MTQRLISASFAVAALAITAVPALAWTVWPDVDFQWYANVGKSVAMAPAPITAPAAAGSNYLIAPGQAEGMPPAASPYLSRHAPASMARTNSFADDAMVAAERGDRASSATPEGYRPDSERR